MEKTKHKIIYTMIFSLMASIAFGSVANKNKLKPINPFPSSKEVDTRVRFWEKIFTRYESHKLVIHDIDHPELIVDIVDFKDIQKNKRERLGQSYIERYHLGAKRFAQSGKNALQWGEIEKRLYVIYGKSHEHRERLMNGDIKLRGQLGLANEFLKAAERAQDYLPYMERIFAREGLPTKLTRLPFVESMFNIEARSAVGASGIWQFMPDTARHYMIVNNWIDERESPFKATVAAAKYLKSNYESLGSWPLAVTAYNHGQGSLKRAIQEVNSKDLGEIIRGYKAPSFQFASKNFYAEFLAAAKVYDAFVMKRMFRRRPSAYSPAPVVLTKSMSVHDILNYTGLDLGTLRDYNKCMRKILDSRSQHMKLPASFTMFVPKKIATKVSKALVRVDRGKHVAYAN